jgi:hypothetical protein
VSSRVLRNFDEVGDGLREKRVFFDENGLRDRAESLKGFVDCDDIRVRRFENGLNTFDDGGDSVREFDTTSRLDVGQTSAEESKGARLNRGVREVEEPEDGLREGLGRHEGDRSVDIVVCGGADLFLVVLSDRGRDEGGQVEETSYELGESRIDFFVSGGASGIDLARELLRLQSVTDKVEKGDREFLRFGGRSSFGFEIEEGRFEVDEAGKLFDDLFDSLA